MVLCWEVQSTDSVQEPLYVDTLYVDTLRSEHIFHPGLHETEVTSSGPGVQRAALPYMEIKTP